MIFMEGMNILEFINYLIEEEGISEEDAYDIANAEYNNIGDDEE